MITEKELDEFFKDIDYPLVNDWQRIVLLRMVNDPNQLRYNAFAFARGSGYSDTMLRYFLWRMWHFQEPMLIVKKEKENGQ